MSKPGQLTAMISSTSIDLPAHRQQAIDACLRQDVFPIAMEHLPASDADAIRVSLEMVDKADIYIGVYGWRYGHIPQDHDISITEMEYNRAVERGIPILVFQMHDNHPLESRNMVEADATAQQKLEALKKRASTGRGRLEFQSAVELRSHIIQSLSALVPQLTALAGETKVPDFHPPNIIPKPPEPYIAHPYSLLQTKDVVGRQAELNLLTDWVTTNLQVPPDTRIFNLVAIGGMGKSALTWKWFNDIAPHELPTLAGRMWWSFYESDAHWENFIIRALAYVSGQSEQAVRAMKSPDREEQLWRILDQRPFLLVLDGLERILLAYARMDAAQMLDDDLDEKTANHVAKAHGLPESAGESFIGKHQLRRTASHRAGQFLRRVTRVKQSRILITTRLYPAELQTDTGDALPGCFASFLTGLQDNDALNLWREFKISGSTEQLLPLLRSVGNYPLLIRALAGEIAAFRDGPRDFNEWHQAHPLFDPAGLSLKNAKTHVLAFALRGVSEAEIRVLHTLASFRIPTTWETLRALLRGKGKPCANDHDLDLALTELEDRGLIGWDKTANRYSLHPIVHAVVRSITDRHVQRKITSQVCTYFEAIPERTRWSWSDVKSVDQLTASIELFYKLVELRKWDRACRVFSTEIDRASLFKLHAMRLQVELLSCLVSQSDSPLVSGDWERLYVLHSLARAHLYLGEPKRCAQILESQLDRFLTVMFKRRGLQVVHPATHVAADLAIAYLIAGSIRKSEFVLVKALDPAVRDSRGFVLESVLGLVHAARGSSDSAQRLSEKSSATASRLPLSVAYLPSICAAQQNLWLRNFGLALQFSAIAQQMVKGIEFDGDLIRCNRLLGTAHMHVYSLAIGEVFIESALKGARAVNFVEEELPALTALAGLHRQRNEHDIARELLEQVWDAAERGPYPLFHADALNVLAQIERDEGNTKAAIKAATKAYTLAWCDGPPYAYHYGLTNARKHLQELGAPEPQLPPFDESKFEPMPDVELNPKDEFWADPVINREGSI